MKSLVACALLATLAALPGCTWDSGLASATIRTPAINTMAPGPALPTLPRFEAPKTYEQLEK